MNGRKKRKAHHNILLLPEIVARRVVVIGTTTSNRCKSPNTTRNPINALFMRASSCSHNALHQRQSTRVAGNLSDCMRLILIEPSPPAYRRSGKLEGHHNHRRRLDEILYPTTPIYLRN